MSAVLHAPFSMPLPAEHCSPVTFGYYYSHLFRTVWAHAAEPFPRWNAGCHTQFFVHLADVLIQQSLCFVLLSIFHVNIGVQGASKTSKMYAALFIKPVKQMSTAVMRLMWPSIKTGALCTYIMFTYVTVCVAQCVYPLGVPPYVT